MNWYKTAQVTNWIFHNTRKEYLPEIRRSGLEAGSFSTRPIDFGGDVWLAVDRDILPENTQEHQYGEVIAIEPGYDNFVIDPSLLYLADHRGRILGPLSEAV